MGQADGEKEEQVVFVPYEQKPLQQRLLAGGEGGNGTRAWPRLNDPGLLIEPSLLHDSGDSAKVDEWDVTPTVFGGGGRWLRCEGCPAVRGGGAVKRCGWRHCCCITSAVLLLAISTVLIMYLRLVDERQLGLPPPPPGLIQPPVSPGTPALQVQLISYLGVAWTAPVGSGGAAVLNWIVETAPAIEGPFVVVATLVSSARYYGTGGLSGAQTVCFRVTAANNAGLGNASLPSCFDTLPPSLPMPPGSLFPTSGTSVTSIGLGWLPGNGSGVAVGGYELQSCDESVAAPGACAAGDDGAYATAYAGPLLSFTAEGLPADSRFWWRVRTETVIGQSPWAPVPPLRLRTDSAGATEPLQPEAPTASAVTSDTAQVQWPEVPEEADGGAQVLEYVLTVDVTSRRQGTADGYSGLPGEHRRPPQSLMPAVDGFRGFATEYEVTGLPANSDFCLDLEVLNNVGISTASTRICDTTEVAAPPTAPRSLWVANTSAIGVIVGWSAAGGNGEQISSYVLQMDDWWGDDPGEPVFHVVATTPGTEQVALVTSHESLRPGQLLLPSMPLRCVRLQITSWLLSRATRASL